MAKGTEERKLKFSQLCGFKKNPAGFVGAVRAKNIGVKLGLVREASSAVGTPSHPTAYEEPVECAVFPAAPPIAGYRSRSLSRTSLERRTVCKGHQPQIMMLK